MDLQNNTSSVGAGVASQNVPFLVKLFSTLMLLGGILELLGSGVTVWLFSFSGAGIFALLGLINLVSAVANIVISFGLRKMKKWALYAVTFFYVLGILVYLYQMMVIPFRNSGDNLIILVITTIITAYFWSLRRQFN